MKRIFLAITILVIVLSTASVWAEGSALSYEEAVQIALENNEDVKTLSNTIDNTNYKSVPGTNQTVRAILLNAYSTLNIDNDRVVGYNGKLSQKGYYINQAKNMLKYAAFTKDQKEYEIKYKIYSLFNTISQLQEKIELSKNRIEMLNEQKRIKEIKRELNMVTELEITLADQLIKSENLNKFSQENNLKSAYEDLNKLMGRVLSEPIEIKGQAVFEHQNFQDIEKAISFAKENRMDLIKEKDTLNLESIRFEVEGIIYYEYSDTYRTQQRTVENQEAAVSKKEKEIEQQIYDIYKSIDNATLSARLAELNLENEKQNYDITVLKYDLGMIVKADLMNAEIKLKDTEIALESARLALEKLKINLENVCTFAAQLGN